MQNRNKNATAWALATAWAWVVAWRHLSGEWSLTEQYQYGWCVPLFFLYIVWNRWKGAFEPGRRGLSVMCAAAAAGPFGLGELLRWEDPSWRLTGALLTLGATGISLAFFVRLGGTPLLRRQAFPLFFAWVAVPWPIPLENWITQVSLAWVTHTTVLLANILGVPALQHGNAVEVSRGILGIEEACSGIRSLQASMMASLFLGELLRLNLGKRVGLLLGSVAVCFATNALRVFAMILLVRGLGESGAAYWHDRVAVLASIGAYSLIGLLAYAFSSKPAPAEQMRRGVLVVPGWDGPVVCGCMAAISLSAWALYHGSQPQMPREPAWKLDSSRLPAGWVAEPLPCSAATHAALRFSNWNALRLLSPQGWSAQIVHLFWKPGESMPGMAFFHTPMLCMGSVGWTNIGPPEEWTLNVHLQLLPGVAYHLEREGNRRVVLQVLLIAGKPSHFLVNLQHPGGGGLDRIAERWRAPTLQVTEEILVDLPDLGGKESQQKTFGELLELLLGSNPAGASLPPDTARGPEQAERMRP